MGKRRRNDRQKLAGKVGFSKVRYCRDHDELVKAVKVFGNGMVWQCKKGCSVDQSVTVLKVPKG
jgi:hypothetical protein